MYCNYCGKELSEDDVFCSQCGNKAEPQQNGPDTLEETIETDTEVLENVSEIETTEENETEENETEENLEIEDIVTEEIEENEEFDETQQIQQVTNEDEINPASTLDDLPGTDSNAENNGESTVNSTETKSNKTKKLAKRYKRGFGTHIGAAALSILLALLIVATLGLFVAQNAITGNSIKEIISSINLEEITVYDEDDKEDLRELGIKCESDNLLDIIYENIDQNALKEPLTKEQFDKIVKDNSVSEYFGTLIGENLDNIVNGKSASIITSEDIIEFIETEKAFVTDVLGYDLTEEHIENLRKTLKNNFGDAFNSLRIKNLEESIGTALSITINVLFSDSLLIAMIILCVLLSVLIFLVLRSFRLGLLYTAIPIIIVDLLYLASALSVMFGILNLMLPKFNADILTQVISVVLLDLVIITFSAVFVGVIMIAVSLIIRKYLIRNKSH